MNSSDEESADDLFESGIGSYRPQAIFPHESASEESHSFNPFEGSTGDQNITQNLQECNRCMKEYEDWMIDDEYWDRLNLLVQNSNICPDCVLDDLKKSGVDVRQVVFRAVVPVAADENEELCLYIQMDYCEKTLRDDIDSGKLSDSATAWKIFAQITEGLAYIHSKGFVHRDVRLSFPSQIHPHS